MSIFINMKLMDILNESEKKYYISDSDIAGKGAFANKNLKKGETIGLLHTINEIGFSYTFEELGRMHNHSENPSCHNELKNNKRYLVASRDINKGEELTTNYRLQPDLEQPDSFLNEEKMYPQKDGYRTYSPFKKLDYIIVDSNDIDCNNIVYDLVLIGNGNEIKFCKKDSGSHFFKNSTKVVEIPLKDGENHKEILSDKYNFKKWLSDKINGFTDKKTILDFLSL